MFRMAPKSSKEFDNISKHFFNFLLVRHPFTRLVSAYKDRIARCKMKAEWYNSGESTIIPNILQFETISVSSMLGLTRAPECRAESNIGKIILNGHKPEIGKKAVIIPTFRNESQL